MAGLMPNNSYTNSQWSCASFTVDSECACICTFAQVSCVGRRETEITSHTFGKRL